MASAMPCHARRVRVHQAANMSYLPGHLRALNSAQEREDGPIANIGPRWAYLSYAMSEMGDHELNVQPLDLSLGIVWLPLNAVFLACSPVGHRSLVRKFPGHQPPP